MGAKAFGKHRLTSEKSTRSLHSRRAPVLTASCHVVDAVSFSVASKGAESGSVDPVYESNEGYMTGMVAIESVRSNPLISAHEGYVT